MRRISEYTIAAGLLFLGTICILFRYPIYAVLPYLLGSGMVLVGAMQLYRGVQRKEYRTHETKLISTGLVVLALGVNIIVHGSHAEPLIGVTWGLIGLVKGIHELNLAIYYMYLQQRFWIKLLHALAEIVLAILLMLNPYEKIRVHIALLGAELILIATQILMENRKQTQQNNF